MKVLLYFEGEKILSVSGIGRARKHQMMALESAGIAYTLDPSDSYDILHINTYFLNSFAMITKARAEGKGIIYHAHSTEEDFRNSYIFSNQISPYFRKYLISLYAQADEIITPTPYSKKILEGYGIKKPITAISNGIDLSRFTYNADKVLAFRRYFSLRDEDKVVLGVGLFFARKGILDFFEVAKRLPQYKFIWFGYTPSVSIPKEINEAINERPLNVIMPGYVKGAILEGAYMAADCFFFPSYEETEGIVVLEALAASQRVVLRDIGAFHPWMVHKQNCFMGKDIDEFTYWVNACVTHKCPDTSTAARLTAEARSIQKVGQALKEVYERVDGIRNEK